MASDDTLNHVGKFREISILASDSAYYISHKLLYSVLLIIQTLSSHGAVIPELQKR